MGELRAGPLTARLDGTELRYICLDGIEIVRRVYVAVRGPLWETVPGTVRNLVVGASEDGFEVQFDSSHDAGALVFDWHGSIVGDGRGRVEIAMSGTPERELVYNRIGICLLLPPGLAGHPLRGRGPEGPWQGELPVDIGPQLSHEGVLIALHPASERLEIGLGGGAKFILDFEGDLFESEDQRNWTDASFKVYGTPLALGLPRRRAAGDRLEQRVTLSVQGGPRPKVGKRPVELHVGGPTGTLVPLVGLGLGSPPPSHAVAQLKLLSVLRPAHLRLDCHLGAPAWEAHWHEAMRVSEALEAALELALFVPRDASALGKLAEVIDGARVARVLVFAEDAVTNTPEETTPSRLLALVRTCFGARYPLVAGTDLNFCELNRTRPDLATVDGLVWPMTPQVHAFDDTSIMETPEAQAAQVATAHHFAPGRPLFVSPVTLLPRYNPNLARPGSPSPADERQATFLGAAFTLSSAKQLSQAGVDAVTYYETVGRRGVLGGGGTSASHVGHHQLTAFPIFHVLADLAAMAGQEVLAVSSSRPLAVTGLAARGEGGTTLLVANTTPTNLVVGLDGAQGRGTIRRLGASTAEFAAREPQSFRTHLPGWAPSPVELGPYETVRIDLGP